MVNKFLQPSPTLRPASRLIGLYVAIAPATIAALAVMSATTSGQATSDAWGHALIVTLFAILLPLRLRSAETGSHRSLIALTVIPAVLVIVNLVQAASPGTFPTWMRIEMVAIAALMAAILFEVVKFRKANP